MNIVKRIVKWITTKAIGVVTKLIRMIAQAKGVPKNKLPTEKDITWEFGYTLIKSVVKSGILKIKDKIMSPFQTVITLTDIVSPGKKISTLAIDI